MRFVSGTLTAVLLRKVTSMRVMARAALVVFCASLVACGGGTNPAPQPSGSTPASSTPSNVSTDKNAYPVFPNADAGADPSVPAEQGGKGFKGDGWETNTDFDLIGDPRAVKGGLFKEVSLEFPGTLRIYGPETTIFNYQIQ